MTMTMQTYRDSYMPCQSNFDPYPNEEWDEQRQAAIETLTDRIESLLARMSDYWSAFILNHHHEPAGYDRQSKLWDLMSSPQQNALFMMLGMPLDDDTTLPCKIPSDKDVRALARTIAEDLIDEVYEI